MKMKTFMPSFFYKLLVALFAGIIVNGTVLAQTVDSTGKITPAVINDSTDTLLTTKQPDTATEVYPPAKMFQQIAESLIKDQPALRLSYNDNKIKYHLHKEAKLFKIPGGESRAVIFVLPDYEKDYTLIIKSMVHGLGYSMHIFAPSVIFLNASLEPIHFVPEKKFEIVWPALFNTMYLRAEVTIDQQNKENKYLLMYTSNRTTLLGHYIIRGAATMDHPIVRSPDGKFELELHER